MLATRWQGCYTDTWQDSIVPEAFCHPAKFSRGLIHRIYRHMLKVRHITEGMTVLDPFGGVALGAVDAMTYGLRYIGVELEPKFVELGNKNLALWRQRYNFTQGTLLQGDSRNLRDILLPYSGVQAVVGSPPYSGSHVDGEDNPYAFSPRLGDTRNSAAHGKGGNYGTTPGQLGAMPPGCVVSSPPFSVPGCQPTGRGQGVRSDYAHGLRTEDSPDSTYGSTPGQLGAMPPGAVVSSPPWDGGAPALVPERQRETSDSRDHGGPGPQYQAMAVLGEPDTFWSAAAQIMQEVAAILPAGAVCAWVVKAYVKNKQIVPFPDQWLGLCEAHGFVLVEEIHASLVEDHGTQEGLFGEAQRVTTEKKSFFRRLAEKKGSPRIDHETVLIVRKAGNADGTYRDPKETA